MERDVKIHGESLDETAHTTAIRTAVQSTEAKENRMTLRRQAQPNILVKVQDILFLFIKNWKWFLLSLAIFMGYAYYQIRKTPNLYQRSAAILIKDDERNFSEINALKELGIDRTTQNVNNEIMALTTTEVAAEVAKRLNLDIEYYREGSFHNQVVYGDQLPVYVLFHDLDDSDNMKFTLTVNGDSTVAINQITKNGEARNGIIKMRMGQTRKTSLGIMSILPSDNYHEGVTDKLIVTRVSPQTAAGIIQSRFRASLRSTSASIIDLNYFDNSPQRAEDILNMIVIVYNENWITDQNRMTVSTNEFIKDRLSVIEQELGDVEKNLADYKSENLFTNVEAVGTEAYAQAKNAESEHTSLNDQIYMTEYLKSYITDGLHNDQLIPANSGLRNQNIESQISDYNAVLLQRNSHLAHSSEQNPLVMDLEEKLTIIRGSLLQSLENEITRLTTMQRTTENTHSQAVTQLSENPAQVVYVNSIERQQKVKEQLYLFLLQKREENELTQAFAAYNSRLIEAPHGSWAPIEPTPQNTYFMALIFALAIPAGILVIKESFNTRIRGRKDLEKLSVPFVGEIPLDSNSAKKAAKNAKEKKRKHKKGKHHHEAPPELVVMEKSRNVMNEAFRVVRSNLEFILGFEAKHHVIMITSLNPSSGKTFITANLASSLGINNKKVIAIDLDMRKGSLSKYVDRPTRGLSNYLSGQIPDYHSVIIKHDYIDFLPCGNLPPNPTELLYGENFRKMMDEVTNDYDYVFLDCPPVEVVADSSIINRYSDMTLFVIRAQLMDRAFLPDIEHWYEEKRYNNLSVILNGTSDAFSRYGYHKYGYRYGYHYGNYGYGYGSNKE